MEIEAFRILLLLSMLGAAAIFDVKSRKIPDVLWLVFGGIGALLYIWDHDRMTSYHVITIFTSVFTGMAIWRWKISGLADTFAIFAMTVILPVHYEFVMMPIMILVMAFFIVVFGTMMYNVSLNLTEMIKTKNWIFSEFKSESKYRKGFAFLFIHRKRRSEKFVILAEKNYFMEPDSKLFVFLFSRNKITRDNQLRQQSNKMYVQNIPPLIIFLFGVAVFLLLPELLSLIF